MNSKTSKLNENIEAACLLYASDIDRLSSSRYYDTSEFPEWLTILATSIKKTPKETLERCILYRNSFSYQKKKLGIK